MTWGNQTFNQSDAAAIQIWLGIFPVNWRQLHSPALLEKQLKSIKAHLGSPYRELLKALILDPALQLALDGFKNHRRRPNENFARELLELFTLGEGNYTEADVIESSRALTGYRLNQFQKVVLNPRRHDNGQKVILGRTAAFNGESLAEWLAEQPATAKNICRRLWRRMIGTNVSSNRLNTLAQQWQQHDLSIPWIMKELTSNPEAITSRNNGLRLSDPLELVSRSLRLLGSRHEEALDLSLRGLKGMEQRPFEPPSIRGWPINEEWITSRGIQARRRTLQQLLAHEEVWESRQTRQSLPANLTAISPLTLSLPAHTTRENLEQLFNDPVWQLA